MILSLSVTIFYTLSFRRHIRRSKSRTIHSGCIEEKTLMTPLENVSSSLRQLIKTVQNLLTV